jgi:hypothetical protein
MGGSTVLLLAALSLAEPANAGRPRTDAGQQTQSTPNIQAVSRPPVEIAVHPFGEWLTGAVAKMLVTIRNTSDDRILLSIPEHWTPEFEYSVLHSPQLRGGEGGGSLLGSLHDKLPYCGVTVEAVLGLPPHGTAYRIVEISLARLPPGLIAAKLYFLFSRVDQTLDCRTAVKLEVEAKTQVRISSR